MFLVKTLTEKFVHCLTILRKFQKIIIFEKIQFKLTFFNSGFGQSRSVELLSEPLNFEIFS